MLLGRGQVHTDLTDLTDVRSDEKTNETRRTRIQPKSKPPSPPNSTHSSSTPPSSTSVDDEETEVVPINIGDVIGCCLDLGRGVASFQKNGVSVDGHVEFHHCCKRITPAFSFSSGVR